VTLGGATVASGRQASGTQEAALPDTNAITPDMVDAGRRIFHGQGSCFACHGPNLEGGPIAPTLKPHAWKDAKGGDLRAIYGVITHGVSGTAMVSHPGGIGDADAAHAAEYIWSVGHRGAKP
jgi:mono/diheme cytochrome c family protein